MLRQGRTKERQRDEFTNLLLAEKKNVLWVIFPAIGRAFTETTMVCHQVQAGVRHSLPLQEHSHLLKAKPHDPHEAQKWIFLC